MKISSNLGEKAVTMPLSFSGDPEPKRKRDKFKNILDPENEHYYLCPECKEYYMRKTLQQIFCCHHCKDSFNNRKKRNEKIFQKVREEKTGEATDVIIPPVVSEPEGPAPIPENPQPSSLEKSVAYLQTLTIDPKEGTHYYLDDLIKNGLDLNSYSVRGMLHNTPDSHYLQFGRFKLFLDRPDIVLVYHDNSLNQ